MKKQLLDLLDVMLESFKLTFSQIGEALPKFLLAILLLVIGWLISKLIAGILGRILKALNFNSLIEKLRLDGFLERAKIEISPIGILKKFVFWFFFLVFIIAAFDQLGIGAISAEIEKLISFLPKIFVAIVIMLAGIYIANILRDLLTAATGSLGLTAGKLISNLAYYFLLFIIVMTALSQTGIDIMSLQVPFLIIFASFAIGGAISYAIASHDILRNILSTFFNKNRFEIGQHITVGEAEGKIVSMNNVSITIEDKNGDEIVIPAKVILNEKVKIKRLQ